MGKKKDMETTRSILFGETVEKSGFYFDLRVDYYDKDRFVVLLHNVTPAAHSKCKMLRYGNESSRLKISEDTFLCEAKRQGKNTVVFKEKGRFS